MGGAVGSFLGEMKLETVLSLMGAAIGVTSFILNLRLVARQEKRNAVNLKMAHDSDIIRWADEVILALARANETLCEKGLSYNDNDFAVRRSEERAQVSALVDRGRLFFPNRTDTDHGADKEAGFQGYRQPVLQELVHAHDVIDRAGAAPGPDRAAAEQLMKHRRKFIAEVFQTVDPVRRGMTLKELAA
ncbi:MAG TPA: hypothetical protein VGO52_11525 [Hyphomonadaceae bacterium]|jgi:hypothetical protein|nr:hypothetical protein [Hyphomonadaceae bacterium]